MMSSFIVNDLDGIDYAQPTLLECLPAYLLP